MTTRNPAPRAVTARCCAPVLRPSRASVRVLTLASVIANAVLVCTGAAVRLSSSGLGYPDWLTFPLAVIAALTFIACLRYQPGGRRRRDLVLLSASLPGDIVVLTRLNPVMVVAHFLLSLAILAAAVVLHARAAEGPRPRTAAGLGRPAGPRRPPGDCAGEPRIRFRDAVEVRRDRRDLRRRFRRAARAAMGERKAEMTAVLRRLSADPVRLSDVVPGARDTGKVVVFTDGTRLLLGIRGGGDRMERLTRTGSRFPVWLADVQPCFGRRLFWLGFTSSGHAVPLAVLASVAPVPPGGPESCPG